MNTLLGEAAMLNDVLYRRYRIALKFHKLQKTFLLDHHEIGEMQQAMLSAGVQNMPLRGEVVMDQLRSAITELYSALRLLRPSIAPAQLKEAQDCCFTWMSMAFRSNNKSRVEAGALKILLALFCGLKQADKAKYIFSVLANANGAVDVDGMGYFCSATQLLASFHQEQLYTKHETIVTLFRDSLIFVRSLDDIRDEEEEGGIRRPFLSAFEFSKLLTSSPEPAFLDWIALWFKLPSYEKVVHQVRCAVCAQKPITSLRYQCAKCPNFHMCQMCFMKGRLADKHDSSHPTMEFQTFNGSQKGLHKLFSSSSKDKQDGHLVTDPQEPFQHTPVLSFAVPRFDEVDNGTNSDYHPTTVRIGGTLERSEKPIKPALVPTKGSAVAQGLRMQLLSGSLDSLLTNKAGKQPADSVSVDNQVKQPLGAKEPLRPADLKSLSEANKRISLEVDHLLTELSNSSLELAGTSTVNAGLGGSLQHVNYSSIPPTVEGLDEFQVHLKSMQTGFANLTLNRGNRVGSGLNKSTPTDLDSACASSTLPHPLTSSASNDFLEHCAQGSDAQNNRFSMAW